MSDVTRIDNAVNAKGEVEPLIVMMALDEDTFKLLEEIRDSLQKIAKGKG